MRETFKRNFKLTAGHGILGIGIDLNQERVLLDKQIVQIHQHRDVGIHSLAAQTHFLNDLLGLFAGQACGYVDGLIQNGVGTAGGNFLNVNATLL